MSSDLHTIAVHAGRDDFTTLGVHAPPIDFSTTYPFTNLGAATESLDALAGGARHAVNPVYARLHNPTVDRFEKGLAALEGAEAAVAFSSGMAALTAILLAIRSEGRHVVAVRPLYGTSDHLLSSEMLGLDVTWTVPGEVSQVLRPETALVKIETPANPTLNLVDIEAVAAQAGEVPVLVDSTFATPVLQQPLRHGAALVLHSATKFIGGHGDVIAGVVACSEEWAAQLRQVRVATGALLHPLGAYLLHRGLPTLPLRVERAQETARELATRLSTYPGVRIVHFPGLEGCDPAGLLGRQMKGPGTLIAFDVGDFHAATCVLASVRLATPAVSLGSVDTLIQHPAGLTHRVVDPETRSSSGITEGLLRLSVGLEAVDDLWDDLVQALEWASSSGDSALGPEAEVEVRLCDSNSH